MAFANLQETFMTKTLQIMILVIASRLKSR